MIILINIVYLFCVMLSAISIYLSLILIIEFGDLVKGLLFLLMEIICITIAMYVFILSGMLLIGG